MRNYYYVVCWICLCCFSLRICSLADQVFNLRGGSGRWLVGGNFNDAMHNNGYPNNPTFYQKNATSGFHCHLNKFYGEPGYQPDGWKHGDSYGGYLIPVSPDSFFEVHNSWNGTYDVNMKLIRCGFCNGSFEPHQTSWIQIGVIYYNLPSGTNGVPPWVFDSPYVQNLQLQTDNPGVNGSTIIGGSFDVVPPAGQTSSDGYFNDYDWNTPPEWIPYYNPEPPASGGSNFVGSAWGSSQVALQLQNSSAIRSSNESIKNSASASASELSDIADDISVIKQNSWTAEWRDSLYNMLYNKNFNPTINVPAPNVNVAAPNVSVTVEPSDIDLSSVSEGLENIYLSMQSNLSESDFPAVSDYAQLQAEHDAEHDAEEALEAAKWEALFNAVDIVASEASSALSGLAYSVVGSWSGLGRSKPNFTFSVALPIFSWDFVVDFTPYENFILFFRAFAGLLMFVGFIFAVYKLLLKLGD